MYIYFILLGIICIDFLLEYFLNRKNILQKSNWFCKLLFYFFKFRIITVISIVLITTLRSYSVGLDTKSYLNYYNDLLIGKKQVFIDSISNKFEYGYTFLNSLFAVCKFDFRFLIAIISIFSSISLVLFVNKFSTNKLMSILMYIMLGVFAQSLNTLRQIIAMSFVLLSLIYLIDNYFSMFISFSIL